MAEVTKELIRQKVQTDRAWATRAIIVLFQNQTNDEQASHTTHILNHVGFNGADAEILSSFAERILRGRQLTDKQLAVAFKKLPKYAGQLLQIALARSEAE